MSRGRWEHEEEVLIKGPSTRCETYSGLYGRQYHLNFVPGIRSMRLRRPFKAFLPIARISRVRAASSLRSTLSEREIVSSEVLSSKPLHLTSWIKFWNRKKGSRLENSDGYSLPVSLNAKRQTGPFKLDYGIRQLGTLLKIIS